MSERSLVLVHSRGDVTVLADRVFDGERFWEEPTRIEIQGDSILRVERGDALMELTGRNVIDVRGTTLLPGLVNSHVHLARGGMFAAHEPFSLAQLGRNLRETLRAGITTVGEMGCSAPMVAAIREVTRQTPGIGPAVLAAGPLVTVPGGYPLDWLSPFYARLGVAMSCSDGREARSAVRRLAEAGMDHIKLAAMHRSYGDRPLPSWSTESARALVDEAHTLGLRVMAHAHSVEDYNLALEAGVDALMHSSFVPLDDETVVRVRDSGVWVCPTLWVFDAFCQGIPGRWYDDPRYFLGVTRAVRQEWKRFSDAWDASDEVVPEGIAGGLPKSRIADAVRVAASNLKLLRLAGVPIAFGNDAAYGYAVHGRPIDELRAMQRAGMDATAVLTAATSTAAQLLGLPDRGRIEVGLRADLIAVEGDPRQDLGVMEQVREVIAAGTPVSDSVGARARRKAMVASAGIRGLAASLVWALR